MPAWIEDAVLEVDSHEEQPGKKEDRNPNDTDTQQLNSSKQLTSSRVAPGEEVVVTPWVDIADHHDCGVLEPGRLFLSPRLQIAT